MADDAPFLPTTERGACGGDTWRGSWASGISGAAAAVVTGHWLPVTFHASSWLLVVFFRRQARGIQREEQRKTRAEFITRLAAAEITVRCLLCLPGPAWSIAPIPPWRVRAHPAEISHV